MSFIYDPDFSQPSHNYVPQPNSWQYITFIKRWAVESMQDAFAAHVSQRIQNTKVAVEFDQKRYSLPAVLVKYNERDNINAGVGHEEWLPSLYEPDTYIKYYHRLYHGDLQFEAYAQSSTDLGLIRDALIEILATTDATPWGNAFVQRLYFYMNQTPYGFYNMPFLSTDRISPIHESYRPLPWNPADKLAYGAGYSIPIMGDLYSATQSASTQYGGTSIIEEVDLTVNQVTDITNPSDTITGTDYYSFTGWPSDSDE